MLTVLSQNSRMRLAQMTRGVHEELHNDPLLLRLSAPDVTMAEVLTALRVYSTLFSTLELQRRSWGQWSAFSLRQSCRALNADIDTPDFTCTLPRLKSREELLGALYSAHSISIAPSIQHANIMTCLPDAPQTFLSQRPDKSMWKLLSDSIDELGADYACFRDIARGALTTALTMQRVASHARRLLSL